MQQGPGSAAEGSTNGRKRSLPDLLHWHRKRRRRDQEERAPSSAVGDAESARNGTKASPSPPCASPPDASPEQDDLHVPSPQEAHFVREDLIRKNPREVHEEYAFEQRLGKGSFGQVHRALHHRTGIRRAIKEIPKAGTVSEDFEEELKALVALDHPHIVKVIEYFDDAANYYIVMELCTGPDLFTFVVEGGEAPDGSGFLSEREVSIVFRQCLKSVLGCHAHGFVHRDLNAKNFMITGTDCTVKLIDFGLATRAFRKPTCDVFIEIVGTAHYMAPEMMIDGEYSPASDLWSLGVLLYVLLTGMMLLPRDDSKKLRLLKKTDYVSRRLECCQILQKRNLSPQGRDLLKRLLQQVPSQRATAAEALSHPFILNHCTEYLGPPFDFKFEFDPNLVEKMRTFAQSPALRKLALLIMVHLASIQHREQDLLAARHTFRTMDENGDGEIFLDELQQGLTNHGLEVPTDLAEVFDGCDSTRSGRLTYVEFVAAILPDCLLDEGLCSEAFNVLDRSLAGRLTAQDLQLTCRLHDLAQCEAMVQQADVGGKGYFDFEDFHRFLCGDAMTEGAQSLRPASPAGAEATCAIVQSEACKVEDSAMFSHRSGDSTGSRALEVPDGVAQSGG